MFALFARENVAGIFKAVCCVFNANRYGMWFPALPSCHARRLQASATWAAPPPIQSCLFLSAMCSPSLPAFWSEQVLTDPSLQTAEVAEP